MLIYRNFNAEHILEVNELYEKYLLPLHLERMGIRTNEVLDNISELEPRVYGLVVSQI